jgi:hypothetical protein
MSHAAYVASTAEQPAKASGVIASGSNGMDATDALTTHLADAAAVWDLLHSIKATDEGSGRSVTIRYTASSLGERCSGR